MTTEDSNTTSATLNRSQAAIVESIRVTPLSQQELEMRRNTDPLPSFNGDPTKWFVFITSYRESSSQYGFSASQNLQRVKDALEEPARSRVEAYFDMPHRLQELLEELEEEYGRPEVLMSHATERARLMQPLNSDLGNINEFYKVVLTIGNALELSDTPVECSALLDHLVTKLNTTQGLDWLSYLGKNRATVSLYVQYIASLCKRCNTLKAKTQHLNMAANAVQSDSGTRAVTKQKTHILLSGECQDGISGLRANAPSYKGWQSTTSGSYQGKQPAYCPLRGHQNHRLQECAKFQNDSVENRWAVVKRFNRCASCFNDHHMANCPTAVPCPHTGCPYRHHPLMHRDMPPINPNTVALMGVSRRAVQSTMYRVVTVLITAGNNQIRTYALMDTGLVLL